MYYPPFIVRFFLFYAVLLLLLFGFLYVGTLEFAFRSLGLSRRVVFPLLLISLLGSSINIPLVKLQSKPRKLDRKVMNFLGRRFYLPSAIQRNRTLLAVNVGGCIIPVVLSGYLVYNHLVLLAPVIVAISVVAGVVYYFSSPVRGVGITVPLLLPPAVAAIISILVSADHAPLVAYVSGTIGTLIGADLFNLKEITRSQPPVASIGGAGTFDGIFLTGVIAVLLTSFQGV